MKNQLYTGTNVSRRFALCPTSILAGDPVLIGSIPGVALDNYQASTGGTTFLCNGSFNLLVHAYTVASPVTGSQINPGDKIYAAGTLDTPTNITYALTLSKASGGVLFGHLDPTMPAVASAGSSTTGVALEAEI